MEKSLILLYRYLQSKVLLQCKQEIHQLWKAVASTRPLVEACGIY